MIDIRPTAIRQRCDKAPTDTCRDRGPKDAPIDLDLLYFRFQNDDGTTRQEDTNSDAVLSHAGKLLADGGRSPKSSRIIQGTPERLDELFKDYGLAVSSLHHVKHKKSPLGDLLYRIPSPLLLCAP